MDENEGRGRRYPGSATLTYFHGHLCAAAYRAWNERKAFHYVEAGVKDGARLEAACTVLDGMRGLKWFAFGIPALDIAKSEVEAAIKRFGRAHLVSVKEVADVVASVQFAFIDCAEASLPFGLFRLIESLMDTGAVACFANAPEPALEAEGLGHAGWVPAAGENGLRVFNKVERS